MYRNPGGQALNSSVCQENRILSTDYDTALIEKIPLIFNVCVRTGKVKPSSQPFVLREDRHTWFK